jgi:hypothetical protein
VEWLDGVLARIALPAPGWSVILVGDAGRSATPESEGFVLVVGEAARAGCVGRSVSPLDVAPLGLSVLGFPRSVELRGRVPASCVAFAQADPPSVASFGRRATPESLPSPQEDARILERLRSLGYVR